MKYADDLERRVGELLTQNGIRFIHKSEDFRQSLDFSLPDFGLYIEVKRFYSERTASQMSSAENVILIQGINSLKFLEKILSGK